MLKAVTIESVRKTKITARQILLRQHKAIYEQELAANRKAKAGWFYDPQEKAPYRYWTGSRWSDFVSSELRHDHPEIAPEPVKQSLWGRLKRLTGRE